MGHTSNRRRRDERRRSGHRRRSDRIDQEEEQQHYEHDQAKLVDQAQDLHVGPIDRSLLTGFDVHVAS